MTTRETARQPEDLTRLFVERANAGDVDGLVALYEPDAVLAFPPGAVSVGHAAIRGVFEQMVASAPRFEPEDPLPTVRSADGAVALTATRARDEAGARAQVVRRQPDGSWLRVLDRPDFTG